MPPNQEVTENSPTTKSSRKSKGNRNGESLCFNWACSSFTKHQLRLLRDKYPMVLQSKHHWLYNRVLVLQK